MRKRVAWLLDSGPWWLWWIQPISCFLIGHEPIDLLSGRTCAYCLKGL